MRTRWLVLAAPALLMAGTAPAAAQATGAAASTPVLGDRTVAWLAATAVLALPEPLRSGAEVRAWTADDDLVTIRPGDGGIICLADRPGDGAFAAACYHAGLEPFMERGRELARQGVPARERTETRWREIEDGTIPMPAAAMVYNLRFPSEDIEPDVDPATGGRLLSLYMPGATAESTGVSPLPSQEPWIMHPGTPTAHIMIALPTRRPDG